MNYVGEVLGDELFVGMSYKTMERGVAGLKKALRGDDKDVLRGICVRRKASLHA